MNRILPVTAFLMAALCLYVSQNRAEPMKTSQAVGIPENTARATFAGGCFWCMEYPFDRLDGVISTTSGYIGGHVVNPTYQQVCSGNTGHTEAVQVVYDPAKVTYDDLLDTFWQNINPTTLNRQFADRGTQYRTGIFYHDASQKEQAEASRAALSKSGKFDKPIVTEITEATAFYPAETYHQDYYVKNPVRYKMYRSGSGRDAYIEETWGDDAAKH